jgi:hypothetical protein
MSLEARTTSHTTPTAPPTVAYVNRRIANSSAHGRVFRSAASAASDATTAPVGAS